MARDSEPPVLTPEVRRARFGAFVERVREQVKITRGWTVVRLSREAGISRDTIYRWMAGDLEEDPKREAVEKFCTAAGVDPQDAFDILWPVGARATTPAPLPPLPSFEILQRRLEDPNVSPEEKYLIIETMNSLAARSPKKAGQDSGGRKRQTG